MPLAPVLRHSNCEARVERSYIRTPQLPVKLTTLNLRGRILTIASSRTCPCRWVHLEQLLHQILRCSRHLRCKTLVTANNAKGHGVIVQCATASVQEEDPCAKPLGIHAIMPNPS